MVKISGFINYNQNSTEVNKNYNKTIDLGMKLSTRLEGCTLTIRSYPFNAHARKSEADQTQVLPNDSLPHLN